MQGSRITTHTRPSQSNPHWQVVDAAGQRLGRLASSVAGLLMGKHKPDYSKHQLSGDFVIVVNAAKVVVTGNPSALKTYYRHTGYIGHLKATPMRKALAERPDRVVERAVRGMLPHNRLGRKMLGRLKVYRRETHPHQAQVNAGMGKSREVVPERITTPLPPPGPAPEETQVLAVEETPTVAAPAAPSRSRRAPATAVAPAEAQTTRRRTRATPTPPAAVEAQAPAVEETSVAAAPAARSRSRKAPAAAAAPVEGQATKRRTRATPTPPAAEETQAPAVEETSAAAAPAARSRSRRAPAAAAAPVEGQTTRRRRRAPPAQDESTGGEGETTGETTPEGKEA